MNKYYNINNLFDENGEPIKVTIKIKRKNNQIDYKTAYENVMIANKMLYKENYQLKKQKYDVVELINYYGITPEQNDNTILRHILKDILRMLGEIE